MPVPHFLFLEIASEHANQVHLLESALMLIERQGGECWVCSAPGRIAALEPGTVAGGMIIAKFRERSTLESTVRDDLLPHLQAGLPREATPLILAVEGLPEEGLPEMMEIPTAASVPKPDIALRNVFLVVRGSATDPPRMNAYRDIILPMHKERGGYYEVFALNSDQVRAISGEWTQQIFAISRWPLRAAAEDFWFCDRYQQQAIPMRLGAGTFTVHLVEARPPR